MFSQQLPGSQSVEDLDESDEDRLDAWAAWHSGVRPAVGSAMAEVVSVCHFCLVPVAHLKRQMVRFWAQLQWLLTGGFKQV